VRPSPIRNPETQVRSARAGMEVVFRAGLDPPMHSFGAQFAEGARIRSHWRGASARLLGMFAAGRIINVKTGRSHCSEA
jgi:hypothetical protein